MNLPSIRALNALALIAETGSVSGAADRMGVTHSAVSHMIRTLEQTIGTELTRRDGRGVTLTSQGHQYASRITPALAQIAEAGSSFLAAALSRCRAGAEHAARLRRSWAAEQGPLHHLRACQRCAGPRPAFDGYSLLPALRACAFAGTCLPQKLAEPEPAPPDNAR